MDYSKMSNEDFMRILTDIIKDPDVDVLSITGIYEILSEHFNNEILDTWKKEQEITNESN